MIRQVLAYYVLSPAMQGMHIKRVIVYEATTQRFIEITLPEQPNWITEERCLSGTYKPIQVKLPIKGNSYKFGRTLIREYMHHLIDTGEKIFRDAMPPISVEEALTQCGRRKDKEKKKTFETPADVYIKSMFMYSHLFTDQGVSHACQQFMQAVYRKKSPFYFNFTPSNLGNSRIDANHEKLAKILHEVVKDLYPKRIDDSTPLEHMRKNFLLYYYVYKELKVFFPLFQYNDNLTIQDPLRPEISRFLTEAQFRAIRDKHTVTVTSIPFSQQYVQSVGLKQDKCFSKVQPPAAKQVAAHSQSNYHTTTRLPTQKFYAVAIGRNNGIYLSWDECKRQVHKYQGAKFKSFQEIEAAEQFYAQYHNGARPRNSE
ncbi:MAG: RNase H1/viroplasmin domain-containing protein, partial [Muribaculaceae bacterium]|nr:RNase H1/viroplasmin domain-containing protein [Muribaculaceae bacterium]